MVDKDLELKKIDIVKERRKLSKANIALIFFTAILLLSVYAQIAYQADMQSKYVPQYYVHSQSLTVKPEKYFVLSNPDQYVLRAINGEQSVFAPQKDTQIYDLERQYDTSNIEYNGSYYAIWIAFVDAFPLPNFYLLAGFAISVLGIVVILIFQVAKRFKPPKK